ncbi:MAG: translation initiation factor IF-2 [Thermodesulfobacteriota bacterium]
MGKVRVYELAKELGLSNKDLVQKLQEMGYPIKSHSSTLEDYMLQEIRDRLLGRKQDAAADAAGRPTVIRRRKKVEPPAGAGEPASVQVPLEAEAAAPSAEEVGLVAARAGEVEPEARPETEPIQAAAEAVSVEEARVEPEEIVEVAVEVEAPATASPITVVPAEKEAPQSVEMETHAPSELDPGIEIKIKKIEKVTAEPARIISRPTPVEPPRLKPVPPAGPRPQETPKEALKPRPAPPPRPTVEPRTPVRPAPPARSKVVPLVPATEAEPGAATAEARRVRKKKKGKELVDFEGEGARKKTLRRREVIERTDLYDVGGWDRPGRARKQSKPVKKLYKTEITVPKAIKRRIKMMEAITVAELAKRMGVKAADVVRKLIALGLMTTANQTVDYETATLAASEFGYEMEKGSFDEEEVLQVVEQDESEKKPRPPVVTVMGHVDHGKTSLLDAIRKTNVTEGEAGGITQHIGAYHVEVNDGRVTFLDTPGHAAFTAMRARGAQVTDIVVLVVAADDGVMQQTREAADHARAAKVPIIVAVNKIDKPEADPDRIRREMAEIGLTPEAWGGETIFVDVSAKTGVGLNEMLELILLQAEVMELKAIPGGRAKGTIIEARLDKGRGPVATVLVESGKLKQGDPFVSGVHFGKVRAMLDDRGRRVDEAGPSMPVEIQGASGIPQAGDEFVVVEDEKKAKQVSQHRLLKQRELELLKTSRLTLETLFDSIKEGQTKELNLVLKADVQGTLEAIADALAKLSTQEIKVNLVHASIGAITESDIMLASASHALAVGFNVRANPKVQELAETEKIQIRYYDVIYKLIDEIKEAMTGLLEPIHEEKVLGRAEVRQVFHVSKVGNIAGSAVTDGKVVRGAKARLLRDGVVVYDGRVISLKRLKDDAKEVLMGFECGIGLDNFNDIKTGDIIEAYIIEDVAATLSSNEQSQ